MTTPQIDQVQDTRAAFTDMMKFSIITCAWNNAAFLAKVISSVLKQNWSVSDSA